MADTAQTARLLGELARRIASSLDLRETLQLAARAVVGQLGFGCALVNMVQPGDMCEVVTIAGPEEAATSHGVDCGAVHRVDGVARPDGPADRLARRLNQRSPERQAPGQ